MFFILIVNLTWAQKANALGAYTYPGYGVIYDTSGNPYLHISNGQSGLGQSSAHQRYDVLNNSWISRANAPDARYDVGSAVLGDSLFIFGGYRSTYIFLNTAYMYNSNSNSWSWIASFGDGREGLRAVAFKNKIYIFGGDSINWSLFQYETVKQSLEYNPSNNSYTVKADMPTGRTDPGASLGINENGDTCIYVIGGAIIDPFGTGATPLATVEEYNPRTNSWRTRASMSVARWGLIAVTLDDTLIYAIGGTNDGTNSLTTVEVYNTKTNTWTNSTPLPLPRDGLGGGSVIYPPDTFYLLSPPNGSIVSSLTPTLDWGDSRASQKIIIACGSNGNNTVSTTYEGDDNIFRPVKYTLKYWLKNGGAGDTFTVSDLTVSQYITPTLINDTVYHWTVSAFNEKGTEFATPDTWWFRTQQMAGTEDIFLTAQCKKQGIYLFWKGGKPPYILYRDPDGENFPLTIFQKSFMDREVKPGKTYTYILFDNEKKIGEIKVNYNVFRENVRIVFIDKGSFKIYNPYKEKIMLIIYNISGQSVYSEKIFSAVKNFEVSEFLSSGTYFINLRGTSLNIRRKFIFLGR